MQQTRGGIKSAVNSEGTVLTGVFINDVTDLDGFSVPGGVKLKIQRPHITGILTG
ncbi:MAG: hypothetical protein Q4B12_02210 [Bowdeniella nasicola]|nr:hypothetical protein [Bowdeniella nasicola]